jgi:HK97 family phage prohead protease
VTDRLAAAAARAAATPSHVARPSERRASPEPGELRGVVRVTLDPMAEVREITRNGLTVVRVGGYASVTESPYEMYDMFGPYSEVVSRGAFGSTLAAAPQVEFTVNHGAGGGLPMAHTRNDTLDLAEDEGGLRYDAYVDPKRADVKVMLAAMQRGDLGEASFKFRIDGGQWSPDYSEFRINSVDLNRGDVSAVNFGANPAATSGVRAAAEAAAEHVAEIVTESVERIRAAVPDDEWTRPRR